MHKHVEVDSRMDWNNRRLETRELFEGSRNNPSQQPSPLIPPLKKNKQTMTEFQFYLKEKSNTNFLSYTHDKRDANLKEAIRD